VRDSPSAHVEAAGAIAAGLRLLGFDPVLVGGMALVILGSRRVTRDFDFLVEAPGKRLSALVDFFYEQGFELVSRLDQAGNVTATIDNRRVATIRIRADDPGSVYFFNRSTRLRIDLLFDFPIAAHDVAKAAARMKILGHAFAVASPEDLLRLKEIASAARSFAGDAQDIEFLRALLARGRPSSS
jgi:hypothetical protein